MNAVVDASFVVQSLFSNSELFVQTQSKSKAILSAPYLLDAEVGQVLRRYYLGGVLTGAQLDDALRLYSAYKIVRYPHVPLMVRALQFRNNITFYDGLYVALAEALSLTLVTRDEKLVSALKGVPTVFVKTHLSTLTLPPECGPESEI